MLISYNWLKDYLGEDIPPVTELTDLLTFHAFEIDGIEIINGDTVMDVKILPDRGSDSLSHRGVAREIATLIDKTLAQDPFTDETELKTTDEVVINIEDKKDCQRFMLAHMTGVKMGPSPEWLRDRLASLGQRSINNIVDATNYVMYSLGQPMHAYDADLFTKKDGKWVFSVRRGEVDEMITLLPERPDAPNREVKLKGTELLVVDESNGEAVDLAGVKGGVHAGLHEGTTNIILEAASFDPALTRRTARSLNIVTDASKRFENQTPRILPPYAIRMIVKLITDIAGGEFIGVADNYPLPQKETSVLVRKDRMVKILGLTLEDSDIENILRRLGAKTKKVTEGWEVTAPLERTDLEIEENYIDEIGRIYGLSHVRSIPPEKLPLSEINTKHYYFNKIRTILTEKGFSEIITSSFRKKDKIHLQNALASDKAYLRSALTPAMEDSLVFNAQNVDVLGLKDIRIFEIGTVFNKADGKLSENFSLAIGAKTKKTNHVPADNILVKEAIDALEEEGISIDADIKNGVCEINLDNVISKLKTSEKYEDSEPLPVMTYKPFSSYPAIVRDIAMWVPEGLEAEKINKVLEETAGDLCVRITLFDQFTKEERTSFAFRLVFQSFEKTLTDDEVQVYMDKIGEVVEKEGWDVR